MASVQEFVNTLTPQQIEDLATALQNKSRPSGLPADESAPGGVVVNPHSPLGKELARWEQHHTHLIGRGQTPGNAYVYRPYPRMLFKAVKKQNGRVVCMEGEPPVHLFKEHAEYQRAYSEWQVLDQQCSKVVNSEEEERLAKGQGWCTSQQEAITRFEQEEQALSRAAAEANFAAAKMSTKAQAEKKALDNSTHEHVLDVTPSALKRARSDQ